MSNATKKIFQKQAQQIYRAFLSFTLFLISISGMVIYYINYKSTPTYHTIPSNDKLWDKIENGIHIRTGLIEAEGLMIVVQNCTGCHSAKLITQNRMTKKRWEATIDWMQETQNLWELGQNEEIIINYLVKNYPVPKKGRRATLKNINWYKLE